MDHSASMALSSQSNISVFPLKLSRLHAFAQLRKQIENESNHLIVSGGERQETGLHILARMLISRRQLHTLLAAEDHKLVGYVSLTFAKFKKLRGNAYLVISVKESHRNKGIGTHLMHAAELVAKELGIRRIELEVIDKNKGAIKLYERLGYEIEGRKRQAVRHNGGYSDMVVMAKLLG